MEHKQDEAEKERVLKTMFHCMRCGPKRKNEDNGESIKSFEGRKKKKEKHNQLINSW